VTPGRGTWNSGVDSESDEADFSRLVVKAFKRRRILEKDGRSLQEGYMARVSRTEWHNKARRGGGTGVKNEGQIVCSFANTREFELVERPQSSTRRWETRKG
jgi:hypothetical protein